MQETVKSEINQLEFDDIWVAEFSQVKNVGLIGIANFLDSNLLIIQLTVKYSTLSSTAQPLQIGYLLKWDFPVVW